MDSAVQTISGNHRRLSEQEGDPDPRANEWATGGSEGSKDRRRPLRSIPAQHNMPATAAQGTPFAENPRQLPASTHFPWIF